VLSVVCAQHASVPSVPFPPPPTHQSRIEIDSLSDGIDFYTSLTRSRFEDLCQDLFLGTVEKVLSDSEIEKSNIHEIVLVGGSTRIPHIVKLVSDFFNGKELNRGLNPDKTVAYGKSNRITITNDKGRLSKDEISRMFREADKYRGTCALFNAI
jgi:L1 cell adhesion molecule like protein